MKKNNFNIEHNKETCNKCGHCVLDCPVKIFAKDIHNNNIYVDIERKHLCFECGHCMAVCPTKSIKTGKLSYNKEIIELPDNIIDGEMFSNFLHNRRSVRVFKDTPISMDVIEKLIKMIRTSPFGVNEKNVEITLITKREIIDKALPYMTETYRELGKKMSSWFMKKMIRKKIGDEKYNSIQNHLMPMIKSGHYDTKNGIDNITRHAPAIMIFHAKPDAEEHTVDAHISMTTAYLAAQSLGLGATVVGLVPPVINMVKEVRRLFKIPADHEAICSIIIGYPKYKYQYAIKREGRKINII
ncbi:MAG: nitroreductase family protein [Bacteroidota bacterium]|nr:nitroreductase family protein [Bacteroidota bacterium]